MKEPNSNTDNGFSEQEVKWLLFYGKPCAVSDIKIDDEEFHLDWAITAMFDALEKNTIFSRKEVERMFWKRIRAIADMSRVNP